MPVQPAQPDFPPVEIESGLVEPYAPEPEPHPALVEDFPERADKLRHERVKERGIDVPLLRAGTFRAGLDERLSPGKRRGVNTDREFREHGSGRSRHGRTVGGDDLLPHAQPVRSRARSDDSHLGADRTVRRHHENIVDADFPPDIEIHVTVDSAIRHVIDDEAERRLVQGFPAVNADSEHVLSALVRKEIGQVDGKGSVAALMERDAPPVDEHLAAMRGTLDSEKDAPFLPPAFSPERPPVYGILLVNLCRE